MLFVDMHSCTVCVNVYELMTTSWYAKLSVDTHTHMRYTVDATLHTYKYKLINTLCRPLYIKHIYTLYTFINIDTQIYMHFMYIHVHVFTYLCAHLKEYPLCLKPSVFHVNAFKFRLVHSSCKSSTSDET